MNRFRSDDPVLQKPHGRLQTGWLCPAETMWTASDWMVVSCGDHANGFRLDDPVTADTTRKAQASDLTIMSCRDMWTA